MRVAVESGTNLNASNRSSVDLQGQRAKEIAVRDVNHRFTDQTHALSEMSFQIAAGEFVVIVGPSGCGKTTILNIIAGLLPKQSGAVTIGDNPPRAGRNDVAYMFTQDALLPWRRVIDNVTFGVEIRSGVRGLPAGTEVRAREILSMVGLAAFEKHYPRQLSHGMRQRVALARTFLMPSPILLMDEPFGALDAHTKLVLEQGLLRLWERDKRTVLFITHDLAEAISLADRILVCSSRPGRITSDIRIDLKRPRNIIDLQNNPRYHEYYQKIWSDLAQEMSV